LPESYDVPRAPRAAFRRGATGQPARPSRPLRRGRPDAAECLVEAHHVLLAPNLRDLPVVDPVDLDPRVTDAHASRRDPKEFAGVGYLDRVADDDTIALGHQIFHNAPLIDEGLIAYRLEPRVEALDPRTASWRMSDHTWRDHTSKRVAIARLQCLEV